MEVRLRPVHRLSRVHSLLPRVVGVEGQQESDEEAGNYHVAQTQHAIELARVVVGSRQCLREDELDGSLHARRHLHHHLGSEDPEDVVEKETGHQNEAALEGADGLVSQRLEMRQEGRRYEEDDADPEDVVTNPHLVKVVKDAAEEGNWV